MRLRLSTLRRIPALASWPAREMFPISWNPDIFSTSPETFPLVISSWQYIPQDIHWDISSGNLPGHSPKIFQDISSGHLPNFLGHILGILLPDISLGHFSWTFPQTFLLDVSPGHFPRTFPPDISPDISPRITAINCCVWLWLTLAVYPNSCWSRRKLFRSCQK